MIKHHNNKRELWSDLDTLIYRGDYLVTSIDNCAGHVTTYKIMRAREHGELDLNIRTIRTKDSNTFVVLVDERK